MLIIAFSIQAEEFESPENFTEFIYNNYSDENFTEVYNNFAVELKAKLEEKTYLDFQQQNFEKYKLAYTAIEVGSAEKIKYDEIKSKFNYAVDSGNYYKLQVKYLLKFKHFGSREKKSKKMVYLRKTKDDFQIFWDYKEALGEKALSRDDQNE